MKRVSSHKYLLPPMYTLLFTLFMQTGTALAGEKKECHHFRLIERTDIAVRDLSSPDWPSARDICVPPGYFRHSPALSGAITDLAITAKWPSMESIWDTPLPGKSYDPVAHGSLINIWFALSRSYPSVDFRFHAMKTLFKTTTLGAPEFGLNHLMPDANDPRPEAELYFESEFNVTRYIECNVPSYAPSPGCKETFTSGGNLITVHYSRVFLDKWRDIEEKTRNLISGFE